MTRATIAAAAIATMFIVLALVAGNRAREQGVEIVAPPTATTASSTVDHGAFIYGRVIIDDGTMYEGRMRWGGDEEALWSHYFNGFKDENPWVTHAASDQLPTERLSIEVLGLEFGGWERELDLGRPFMARFGDIARIDPRGVDVQVTLKSGTAFTLDRLSADDLADGVRVWDADRGVVDIGEWRIRSIELLPTAPVGDASYPLHGIVRTAQRDFTGLIQWDREANLGHDELTGRTADGELRLRFDAIRSVARHSDESALVTLHDGSERVLSGTRQVGEGNRGVYVDDPRYGRVLVSWDAFERLDFTSGSSGPAYDDYPPGRELTGTVTTRSGHRHFGRLVYDLDESETTETLDAPWQGVDYTIPFGFIASIELATLEEGGDQGAKVTLQSGEELRLELAGDLGEGHAGMLIFVDGGERPEYIPWSDVEQIVFDSSPEM